MRNIAAILVEGQEDQSQAVINLLNNLNFEASPGPGLEDLDLSAPDPNWEFLVCSMNGSVPEIDLPQQLSIARADRNEGIPPLPVITIGGRFSQADAGTLTDTLNSQVEDINIEALSKSLARLSTLETELQLRRKTSQDFGRSVLTPPLPPTDVGNASVLICASGLDAPMARATLDNFNNITIVEDKKSAFALICDENYDVVIFIVPQGEAGLDELTITWECRQNTQLYNLPIVFVARDEAFASGIKAFEDGANEYIRHDEITERLRSRTTQIVRRHLYRNELLKTCAGYKTVENTDRLTNMFDQEFFNAHFENHLVLAQKDGRELSLATFFFSLDEELVDNGDYRGPLNIRDLYIQRMSLLMNKLARGEDTWCRFNEDKMVLILPDTDQGGAELVTSRICAIVNNTELGSVTEIGIAPHFLQADVASIKTVKDRDAALSQLGLA